MFKSLYEPLVFRYVRSRGVPEQDVAEIVQDVFVRLVQQLPAFQLDHNVGRFRTWLWHVTMSAIADYARRQDRRTNAEAQWLERFRAHAGAASELDEAEWRSAYRMRVVEFGLVQFLVTIRGFGG